MTNNRTTTVLGAGAILDFDFQNNTIPTTHNITQKILEKTIQGLNEENLELIREVYNSLYENDKKFHSDVHPEDRQYKPDINFEQLFDVIETLSSYNNNWMKEGYPYPLIASLVMPQIHYHGVEYYRALRAIASTIMSIINEYNSDFIQHKDKELWYRNFWKGFNGRNDIFNFNYDTTIENSLEKDYNDGFIPFTPDYERFSPKHLIKNEREVTTINHLHGCVLYADANPLVGQHEYSHRDLFKFKSYKDTFLSPQWLPQNQAKEYIFYSPIITGLKKTDKICYLPHSYYHTNLSMKILENPSLMIIGYSFGDIYANQLIERHKLIHENAQRVVVIDKYPDYVNQQWGSLYQYFSKRTSSGFHNYVLRQLEEANPFEAFKNKIEKIHSNVWQATHKRFRLYTGGFKNAVESYTDDLMNFLTE